MDYLLKRSKRRTMALEVTREGQVILRAPQAMPQATIEVFAARQQGWVEKQLARCRAHEAQLKAPDEAETARLRQAAAETIPARVAHYAQIMGLRPTGVKITSAQKRFGSCSARNSLCFSYLLLRYPPEAIDFVVVHELAHIVHKNHGPAFYRLIERVLPDYRERRSLLKF